MVAGGSSSSLKSFCLASKFGHSSGVVTARRRNVSSPPHQLQHSAAAAAVAVVAAVAAAVAAAAAAIVAAVTAAIAAEAAVASVVATQKPHRPKTSPSDTQTISATAKLRLLMSYSR